MGVHDPDEVERAFRHLWRVGPGHPQRRSRQNWPTEPGWAHP
jgi:hypothetical protein